MKLTQVAQSESCRRKLAKAFRAMINRCPENVRVDMMRLIPAFLLSLSLLGALCSCDKGKTASEMKMEKDQLTASRIKVYTVEDTIIEGPAPEPTADNLFIGRNFKNLPIRDLNFYQIMKLFGCPRPYYKVDKGIVRDYVHYCPDYSFEIVKNNLDSMVYEYEFDYNDGTHEHLLLNVIRQNNELVIIDGRRARYLPE